METPIFVTVDPSTILEEIIDQFQSIIGREVLEGEPEYSICTALAYRECLLYSRINEAAKSMLLSFSSGIVTDYIGELVGVTRLTAQKALCTLSFTLISGHLQVTLPLGTRVASSDGQVIFETTDDVTIPVGTNTVSIQAECQTEGISGNGYGIGSISILQDPYAFVQSVSNTDITAGGSDAESDAELISRIRLAPSQFSTAGSRSSYEYLAKSANSLIVDVKLLTYEDDNSIDPGTVQIYALLDGGNIPSEAIRNSIYSYLTSDTVRPLTDTVEVLPITQVNYSISINIVPTENADSSLQAKIQETIQEYADSLINELGASVVKNKIEAVSFLDGVHDATATITSTGTIMDGNLIISKKQVSKLTGITVNILSPYA